VPRDQRQAGLLRGRVIDRHRVGTIEEDAAMRRDAVEVEAGTRKHEPGERLDRSEVARGQSAAVKTRVDLDLDPEHDSGGGRPPS